MEDSRLLFAQHLTVHISKSKSQRKKNGAEENTDFSQLGQGANSLAGTKTNVLTVAKTGGGGKLSGDSNFAAVDGATWQGFTRLLPCP